MNLNFNKTMAFLTLVSFSSVTLISNQATAGELQNSPYQLIENYSYVVAHTISIDSLALVSRLTSRSQVGSKTYSEIQEVLSRSQLASKGQWVKAVNVNSNTFELSTAGYSATVTYSQDDSNLVQINGKSFVINSSKTLQQNAEAIAREISSQKSGNLKIVQTFSNFFLPEAKAFNWIAAGAVVAVVGIVMAIVGIRKRNKEKNESETSESSSRQASTQLDSPQKYAATEIDSSSATGEAAHATKSKPAAASTTTTNTAPDIEKAVAEKL